MKLVQDSDRFDNYQVALIKEITQAIAVKLVETGMQGEQMENTTANIAFSIASILDDTSAIKAADDEDVHPYLTFRSGENELVHCGENSYTYELLTNVLEEMFEAK
ncbi:MAG: hypothetical protein DRQ47_08610 [Gammaproteobacteria bacterium]|nr:MAG: hypothetical protein DRQ47_08610 [Gammaproteobacteria bacterium]